MQANLDYPTQIKSKFAIRVAYIINNMMYGQGGLGEQTEDVMPKAAIAFWLKLMPKPHAKLAGEGKGKGKGETKAGLRAARNLAAMRNMDLSPEVEKRVSEYEEAMRANPRRRQASVEGPMMSDLYRLQDLEWKLTQMRSPYVRDARIAINLMKDAMGI